MDRKKKSPLHIRLAAWPPKQRLDEAAACLDRIEFERAFWDDPNFGKSVEDRLISRELIELELQEADEQMARILDAAA
jgi:hypothetical protein